MLRPIAYLSAFTASFFMCFATGCASGGYHLTREYATWVNSNQVIIRVILYIFTIFVFGITLLIDGVFFNTMDFWQGKVSAGDFSFKGDNKTFQAHHEILPNNLKRSTIRILNDKNVQIQELVLNQTTSGEIELYVDGKLRSHVKNLSELPIASFYDEKGNLVSQSMIFSARATAMNSDSQISR